MAITRTWCPGRRSETEIATDFYHGGLVVEESASVHPAKLYDAMLRLTRQAGAGVLRQCCRGLDRVAGPAR